MIQIADKAKCSGCHACYTTCPVKCISMEKDQEGFRYPVVNEDACIQCGLCERICPLLNHNMVSDSVAPLAYAAVNQNKEVRRESSSGGVFTLVAELILDRGGVVFGAAFDEQFCVRHVAVHSKLELSRLRGAKYVQSVIGDAYLNAKMFLDQGQWVLFTGTPCQIGGLMAYLRQDYDKLICQDIICHGVASPMVWDKYKDHLEHCAGAKLKKMSFRDKVNGWNAYSLNFEFSNGEEYVECHYDNLYMRAFLRNLCLRPSCYQCNYKTRNRQSDITLADLWGANEIAPEMNDNKGISLLIIHTYKGRELIKLISAQMQSEPVDLEYAISHNRSMVESETKPEARDKFMQEMESHECIKTLKKYCGDKGLVYIKRKIRGLIKRS